MHHPCSRVLLVASHVSRCRFCVCHAGRQCNRQLEDVEEEARKLLARADVEDEVACLVLSRCCDSALKQSSWAVAQSAVMLL